jgi:hypothetical protein
LVRRSGNKKDNITIIYTPWSNVKKTGDMATGSVSFHNERVVRSLAASREVARDTLMPLAAR